MSGEKTEQPTAKKRRDNRKQGMVFKSRELLLFLISLCQVCGLVTFIPSLYSAFYSLLQYTLESAATRPLPLMISDIKVLIAGKLLPPLISLTGVFIAGIFVSHILQFGLLLNLSAIKCDITHISPHKGIKKIFSLNNIREFIKSVIKAGLLSLILFWLLRLHYPSFVRLVTVNIRENLMVAYDIGQWLLYLFFSGVLIIVLADIVISRHGYQKKMLMTKEEIKNEYKESEGNSEIKGKRKQFHKEIQQQDMRSAVRKSRCIVVNPTHYAVGIDYREDRTPLPVITFKEQNDIALHIRRIARQEGVPLIEKKYLARYLYRVGQIGSAVPPSTLEIIAEILYWLEKSDQYRGADTDLTDNNQ
ncbi:EscU/YscU/HrcU family type III secretion system export apparatus switch protein [Morganella morganii]|uniref:EscU/YscU/HrcU family type III secretion system export apparatus switch protein n=1 Tax=Morganella morganii TaxID=582 RepID=UPI0032DA35C6